jgi:DNA-binding NarL/FixJ family response regulator
VRPIRVLIAEDHPLFRAGIRALLQRPGEVEVVAEASDGVEALQLLERHRPDVVVLDVSMPRLDGLQAAARISVEYPRIRVLVLSLHDDARHVQQAVRAGVAGYLLKDRAKHLMTAVRTLARGRTYFSPSVAPFAPREAGPGNVAATRLTPRQQQILKLIAAGHTTKSIADQLGISVKTADTHRTHLMDRLDIHDVAGLVRYAIRMGLVGSDK